LTVKDLVKPAGKDSGVTEIFRGIAEETGIELIGEFLPSGFAQLLFFLLLFALVLAFQCGQAFFRD
jgi:hypothetical protein